MSGEPSQLEMSTTLRRAVPAEKPTKPLIILCDGTWCGRETGTETNIYKLAERIWGKFQDDAAVHQVSDWVCYVEGVGLGSSLLEYVPLLTFYVYQHDQDNCLRCIVTSSMVSPRRTLPVSALKFMNSLSKIIHIQIMKSGCSASLEVPTW